MPSTITGFGISANFETVMFYFDAVNDIDLDSYAYQLYDIANPTSSTTPIASGKNKANVFTISVTNSTDSTPKTYYGRVAVVNSAGIVGTYTSLVSSGATPLIGNQYITSLTAAKITSGTVSAAEITLNGTNSVIKSSTYDGSFNGTQWTTGNNGWLISGSGQAIFSATQIRGTVAAGSINLNTDNYWLPNSVTGPIFKVGNATKFFEWDGANVRTTGTVITNATVSGGTVGGIASGTASLYFGANTYANANTSFYVDTSSRFSLGDKLYFDGANLTVNGGGIFTGTLQVGNVELGNNVGPGSGHHGISLSPNDFNNIFLRRESDGVYFFRIGQGGSNSLTWDSSSGALNVTGTINASGGTITGYLTSGGVDIGVLRPGNSYYKGINLSPNNATDFQSCFIRGNGGEVFLRADNGSQWVKFENGTVQIKAAGFEVTGNSAAFSGSITGSSITANSSILVGSSTSLGYMQLDVSTDLVVNGMRFQNRQYAGWHNSFYPYTDGQYDLSVVTTPSLGIYRWDNVYCTGNFVDQSDVRSKNTIIDSDLGLDFINKLRPVSYFKNAHKKIGILDDNGDYLRDENDNILYDILPGKRRHYGLIAQEVRQVISDIGKTSFDFSGWGKHDPDDPESEQTLTYTEFIAPIIKSLQELSAKVDELESRLV